MSRKKKRRNILIGTIVLVLVGLFIAARGLINPILETTLDAYLREKLEVRWASPTYRFSYEDLEIDILARRITFTDFRMTPLDEYRELILKDTTARKALRTIKADEITVKGIGLMNFLWDKNIEIDQIDLKAVTMDLLVSPKLKKTSQDVSKPEGKAIEGISLPGIQKLSLGRFNLGNFEMNQISKGTGDTLLSFHSDGGTLDGISLKKADGDDKSYFEPNLKDLVLQLNSQVLDLKKDLYQTSISDLKYSYDSDDLEIQGITFEPRAALESFRNNSRYSYEIYDATVHRLFLEDFNLDRYLDQGIVFVKKMELDSLHLNIFRDKTKPFDTEKRVLLLNQKMEALDFPLHIGAIEVKNSYLQYTEQSDYSTPPMVLDFSDLEVHLSRLTSIPDSIEIGQPLEIELAAKLDRSVPIRVKLNMPYNHSTFTLTGHTEKASSFASLNKTVLPALGLKFTSGSLDGIDFHMAGTPYAVNGELTLRYHDLTVEIDKPDNQKRKTLSWVANTVLKKSNPNPNGKMIVGEIAFDRIPYKGLGNFAWKGVQSGLVNSINPFGNHRVVKPQKAK
ncbi:hypothetical protein [Robiginitalea sp.]|uniref:hypothetical protein n=1 Tax=Robiginitalea sp. TaxID=1902411 RepID=UPI003C757C9C